MAVVKVFSSKGTKTVVMLGNVADQDFDATEEIVEDSQASEADFDKQ